MVGTFALAGLALMALHLAGCSGGSRPGASARPRNPMPEEPLIVDIPPGVPGGRIVVSILGAPKSFNVTVSNESATNDVISGAVWEGLLEYDNVEQRIQPGLVSRWESNAAGTVWTMTLRKGLRWSDGAPLTTDDVMFTAAVLADSVLRPNSASLLRQGGKFPTFAKVDDLTFTVTLEKPFGPFLHAVSGPRIIPKHKLEAAWKAGRFSQTWGVDTPPDSLVGSGAFVIARYVPNESVVLKPNPWYYKFDSKKQRLPYLDELIWVVVPDQNAEVIKFKSGEIDGLYIRPEDYDGLKAGEAAGGYSVVDLGSEYGSNFLWFNENRGRDAKEKPYVDPIKLSWFTNRDFRRAIAHAIDRESIIRNVFHDRAVAQHGPIPDVNKEWHNAGIVRYDYDLDKSRQILASAGFADKNGDGKLEDAAGHPVSFRLNTNSSTKERIGACTLIAEDLKKIGIEVQFQPVEFNTLTTLVQQSFDYDAAMLGLSGGNPPDPVMAAGTLLSSGATHFWWPNQKTPGTAWEAAIDSLYDAQLGLSDTKLRKPYVDRIQAIFADEQPAIYTVSRRGFVAVRHKLRNARPSIFRPYIVWNAEELWIDPKAGGETASK